MQLISTRSLLAVALVTALIPVGSAVARKKPAPAPIATPSPAPKPVYIPYRPVPPLWAPETLKLPRADATGLWDSVNRGISPAQTTWNLRSGYNVAALNCRDPKHAAILINYKAFLKVHAKGLALANSTVDAEWRKKYGAGFIRAREKYMTEVYNHFAYPPTLNNFCDAALAVSKDGVPIKAAGLTSFAARSLPNLEVVFDTFYRDYAQWQKDVAEWDAKYGAKPARVPGK